MTAAFTAKETVRMALIVPSLSFHNGLEVFNTYSRIIHKRLYFIFYILMHCANGRKIKIKLKKELLLKVKIKIKKELFA